jgi:hypothetical protein
MVAGGVGKDFARTRCKRSDHCWWGCTQLQADRKNGMAPTATLDRRTRVGLDRHSKLRRRGNANHCLLEVEGADS